MQKDFITVKEYEREIENELAASKAPLIIERGSIATTERTSNVKLITRIPVEYNRFQYLVATAKLDSTIYGALFDRNTQRGYVVILEFIKGRLAGHRDLINHFEDEEWLVMSHFFEQERVFDCDIVNMWLWCHAAHKDNPELMAKLNRATMKDIIAMCPEAVRNGTVRSATATPTLMAIHEANKAIRKGLIQ